MDEVYGYHTSDADALAFTAFLDRKASVDIRSMTGSGNTVSFGFPILSYSLALQLARMLLFLIHYIFPVVLQHFLDMNTFKLFMVTQKFPKEELLYLYRW